MAAGQEGGRAGVPAAQTAGREGCGGGELERSQHWCRRTEPTGALLFDTGIDLLFTVVCKNTL